MAPHLPPAKKQLICDMTKNGMSISDTASAAECSEQAVKNIRSNLRLFGIPGTPPNRTGSWPNIYPPMLDVSEGPSPHGNAGNSVGRLQRVRDIDQEGLCHVYRELLEDLSRYTKILTD